MSTSLKSIAFAISAALFWSMRCQAEDVFPIGFWYGPPARANTLEAWKQVADAHFTIAGPCYPYGKDDNKALLSFCQQVGLKAIVVDERISPEMVAASMWRDVVRQVVADYEPSPALHGYFLHDEPSARWFPALGEIHAEFRQRDPNRAPYINLFPSYAAPRNRGTATHRQYLRQFVETVRPALLSYDHYPLLSTGDDRSDYFENLEAVRSASADASIPFWSIVLAAPHEIYRDPTAEELQWQVYTSLAYGARGIWYFTYWPAPSLTTAAIVDADGNPTARYGVVSKLNRKILAIGPTLLTLRSTAVYHSGSIPSGCVRLSSEAVLQVPADKPLLIGCFEDAKKQEYVMLVNRDYRNSQEFAVELRPDVVAVASFSAADGARAEVPIEQRRFALSLAPGEGRLFAVKTQTSGREPFRPLKEIDFTFCENDEDWSAEHGLAAAVIELGMMRSVITGDDPYFSRKFLAIPPDRYRRIVVRMKLPGRMAQFYWQTADELQFDGSRHLDFTTTGDGEFHEYAIELDQHPGWKGQEIRAIRLDPAVDDTTADLGVEIDSIRGE